MTLQLGEIAPDFTVESTEGTLGFHQWLGKDWAVLFSHPADYTPVCTTELGAFARRKDEFAARGVKLVGVSVDPLASHHDWARDIEQTQGAALNYPLLADADQVVAQLYGMIHPKADPKVSSGIFTTTLLTLLSIPAQRWWTFHRTHEAPCESVTLS